MLKCCVELKMLVIIMMNWKVTKRFVTVLQSCTRVSAKERREVTKKPRPQQNYLGAKWKTVQVLERETRMHVAVCVGNKKKSHVKECAV